MVVKKFSPEKDTYNMLMIKEEKAEPKPCLLENLA